MHAGSFGNNSVSKPQSANSGPRDRCADRRAHLTLCTTCCACICDNVPACVSGAGLCSPRTSLPLITQRQWQRFRSCSRHQIPGWQQEAGGCHGFLLQRQWRAQTCESAPCHRLMQGRLLHGPPHHRALQRPPLPSARTWPSAAAPPRHRRLPPRVSHHPAGSAAQSVSKCCSMRPNLLPGVMSHSTEGGMESPEFTECMHRGWGHRRWQCMSTPMERSIH